MTSTEFQIPTIASHCSFSVPWLKCARLSPDYWISNVHGVLKPGVSYLWLNVSRAERLNDWKWDWIHENGKWIYKYKKQICKKYFFQNSCTVGHTGPCHIYFLHFYRNSFQIGLPPTIRLPPTSYYVLTKIYKIPKQKYKKSQSVLRNYIG